MNAPQERRFDYIAEAHQTLSPSFHGDKVPFPVLIELLTDAADAANRLDKVKKSLFYGRDLGGVHFAINPAWTDCKEVPAMIGKSTYSGEQAVNLLHAIIGKFTEAGELVEALLKAIGSETLDAFNVREEIGDGFWYDAILLQVIGSNFGEAQAVNIEKLRKRFPEKFTEYDANNRDLTAERKILEQKS